MTDSLSALPAELASIVNRYVLDTVLFHIKPASFSKYGSPSQDRKINPYRGQWLVPVVRTPCSSLLLSHFHNARVAADVRDLALSLHPSLLIAYIKNFDLRALQAFCASLSPAEQNQINRSNEPKIKAVLNIDSSGNLNLTKPSDGWKIGVAFRKAPRQSRIPHRRVRGRLPTGNLQSCTRSHRSRRSLCGHDRYL